MKKTAIALIAATAALLTVSCRKEAFSSLQKESSPMTINAVAEGLGRQSSKAELAFKYDVLWNIGDRICVRNSEKSVEFTLADGAGTTEGTFTSQTSITGEVEGFYPSDVADLVWPSVQQNNQVPPMYCRKNLTSTENQTFNFTSLGAVLQIVFNTTQAGITLKEIEIKDAGRTMSGAFTVDSDGKAVITATDKAGITLDLGTGTALGKGANYFNMAVPANDYTDLTLIFAATDGSRCTFVHGAMDITHNTVGKLTLTGENFKPDLPAGALPGKFTVDSSDKKVYFSKGNLQATYNLSLDEYSWAFAEHQYDYVGNASGNTTINAPGEMPTQIEGAKVDLFGWRAEQFGNMGPEYYGITVSTNQEDYGLPGDTSVDWGSAIDNQGTWRPLSSDEWHYLLDIRTMTNVYFRFTSNITYGGKMGLVLYPDDYSGSQLSGTVTEIPEGVVFLPAAGCRTGSDVSDDGSKGYYWSSTHDGFYSAQSMYFDYGHVTPDETKSRIYGCSVRLVTECK